MAAKRNEPTRQTCGLVDERAQQCCEKCGMHAEGGSRHHRRSKRVKDEHTHEASNLVLLCGSGTTGCHQWVHAHPIEAELLGLWVSSYEADPSSVPVVVMSPSGLTELVYLDDLGRYIPAIGARR